MKKIAGVYEILIGIVILGLWTMLFRTGNVAGVEIESLDIRFSIFAESAMGIMFITGILFIISGIGAFRSAKMGFALFVLTIGLIVYSVINASGYLGQSGEWLMVTIYSVIYIISIFIISGLIKRRNINILHKLK